MSEATLLTTVLVFIIGRIIWGEISAWRYRRHVERVTKEWDTWRTIAEEVQLRDIQKWLEENDEG